LSLRSGSFQMMVRNRPQTAEVAELWRRTPRISAPLYAQPIAIPNKVP
jgi:hypothetical protein